MPVKKKKKVVKPAADSLLDKKDRELLRDINKLIETYDSYVSDRKYMEERLKSYQNYVNQNSKSLDNINKKIQEVNTKLGSYTQQLVKSFSARPRPTAKKSGKKAAVSSLPPQVNTHLSEMEERPNV